MSDQGHKKNTNGSLATLPNEVGRVTSDQKVGRVTSDHLTPISSHPPFAILRLWTSSYSLWPSSTASSSPRLPPGTIRDEVVVEVEMMSGIQFGILFVVCHPGPKKGWFLLRKPCWIYKVSYISMRGPHIQTQAGQLIAL